jgi:hypothetical protein
MIILLALSTFVRAETSGLSLLRNEHGARQAAMGAAAAALTGDVNATVYNPAAADGIDQFTASFGHTVFWENIRFESGYFAIGLWPKLVMHGGLRLATIDEIESRTGATDEPDGLFDSHDMTGKLGVSYTVSDKVSAGLSAGWVFEEIGGVRGSQLNFDLGVIGRINDKASVGASVTGLGGDLNLSNSGSIGSRDIPLPTTWRLGGSYRMGTLVTVADFVLLDSKGHLHLGAEKMLRKQFGLRAGYMTGYDSKGFTAGASFSMRNVTVDYAFLPFSNNLGSSHLFNVTFTL